MDKDYKIFSYVDKVIESYKEPVSLVNGLTHNAKEVLSTIEFYSNNQYKSGNTDELGREKPFYNVGNYRVTIAKVGTDVDIKDIKYEPDSLDDSVPTMLVNRELYKYLKESNFGQTLNEMGLTRPKYGGVLVKKCLYDGELKIEVVEWKNVDFDPVDIMAAPIIETHYMQPSEVLEKADVWENTSELIKAHSKANKNKPARVEIKEITGEFPVSFDPDEDDTEANNMEYKTMCFYIGVVNKKKFLLYKEDLKDDEDKYKYLAWEKVPGRSLGRGIIEDGFESQVWVNDSMISIKNAMQLSGKVILSTDSQKVSGNAITGIDNGHIFQLEPGRSITSLNLAASAMPEYQNIIQLWNDQYDKTSSTYNANTGEAPTAGTPYSQTALLNQVANSPFEYQREVWGIFLNEILNDWIFPFLVKRLLKGHNLVSDFSAEELQLIDETIHNTESNKMVLDKVFSNSIPTPYDFQGVKTGVEKSLGSLKGKREVKIPEKFLDIKGKITANITGELKNKSAVLQSLDGVLKTIVSTFNPNTGQYAALQDPVLSKILGSIVEMSGIPLSSAQLKPSQTAPTQMQDLSAVQPAQPVQ